MVEADLAIAIAARATGPQKKGSLVHSSVSPSPLPLPPSPSLSGGLSSTGSLVTAIGNDTVTALLNRSSELLFLKRQAELQAMASLATANGGGLGSTQRKGAPTSSSNAASLPGKTGAATTPSSESSDVEILKTVPAAGAAAPRQTSDVQVVVVETTVGKRGAAASATAAAHTATASAGKRQKRAGHAEAAAERTDSHAASGGLSQNLAGGSAAASTTAPPPLPLVSKPKSIIDFFASRTKAAAARKSCVPRASWRGLGSAASESDDDDA